MPKIHVVYDPNDKIQNNPEMERATGMKVAMVAIHEDMTDEEIKATAQELAALLLRSIRGETDHGPN